MIEKVTLGILTPEETQGVYSKEFVVGRLAFVRDAFLFSVNSNKV